MQRPSIMSANNKNRQSKSKVSMMRNEESLREQTIKAATRKLTRDDIDQLIFKVENGGWIVPPSKIGTPSVWKKLSDKKICQINNQSRAQNNLNNPNKKRRELDYETPNDSGEDDSSDTDEVDIDELFNVQPICPTPFNDGTQESKGSIENWQFPGMLNPQRVKKFQFEHTNPEKEGLSSPTATVKRLHQIIEDRDKHITILRKQLLKIHQESAILAEEVSKRRGPDASDLQRQNRIMRDQLERCLTENAILRGKLMAHNNTIIQKLQHKQMLEDKCSAKNSRCKAPGGRAIRSEPVSRMADTSSTATRSVSFSPTQLNYM